MEDKIIKEYLGIPYLHKGRAKNGFDCWGLIIDIYKNIGIDIFDIEEYDKEWHNKKNNFFLDNYAKEWVKVSVPHRLDVVLFKNSFNVPCHAGIILDCFSFLHCADKKNVQVGRLKVYKNKIFAFFRNKRFI